mgnify:CR=1 FL=1
MWKKFPQIKEVGEEHENICFPIEWGSHNNASPLNGEVVNMLHHWMGKSYWHSDSFLWSIRLEIFDLYSLQISKCTFYLYFCGHCLALFNFVTIKKTRKQFFILKFETIPLNVDGVCTSYYFNIKPSILVQHQTHRHHIQTPLDPIYTTPSAGQTVALRWSCNSEGRAPRWTRRSSHGSCSLQDGMCWRGLSFGGCNWKEWSFYLYLRLYAKKHHKNMPANYEQKHSFQSYLNLHIISNIDNGHVKTSSSLNSIDWKTFQNMPANYTWAKIFFSKLPTFTYNYK